MPKRGAFGKQVSTTHLDVKTHSVALMGCALVEFCPHALDRLKQRSVSEADVLQALRTPSKRGLRADPPYERLCWQKDANTSLHVVYWRKKPKLIVVTAYFQDN